MKWLFFVIFELALYSCVAQSANDSAILSLVFSQHPALFASKIPCSSRIVIPDVSRPDTVVFATQAIPLRIFSEIDLNSKKALTDYWKDAEMPGKILVFSPRDNAVSFLYVKNKLKLSNKVDTKKYKKYVRQFNRASPLNKTVLSISRPVYDNLGEFAAVSYEYNSEEQNNGETLIYHGENGIWKLIGSTISWFGGSVY